MITEQIITLRKQLKSKLEPMRFEHSVSVSFTCTALAMRYAYDIQKAELAGLMHDCAKRFTDSELIRKCQKHGVALTEAEIKAPAVIHAKYGAYLAENKYGIQDPEIISAIACHTTGKPDIKYNPSDFYQYFLLLFPAVPGEFGILQSHGSGW